MRKAAGTIGSWKLNIIEAANADPDIKPAAYRFLCRILFAVDGDTWDGHTAEAFISDETIADDVPNSKDRHTLQDHRKALRDAGWLRFIPGKPGQATTYRITDAKVNSILDQLIVKRDERKERRQRRDLARAARVGKRHQKEQPLRGETSPHSGELSPHLHPVPSPSRLSHPVQDVALGSAPKIDDVMYPCALCGDESAFDSSDGEPDTWRCERHRRA